MACACPLAGFLGKLGLARDLHLGHPGFPGDPLGELQVPLVSAGPEPVDVLDGGIKDTAEVVAIPPRVVFGPELPGELDVSEDLVGVVVGLALLMLL